MRHKKKMFKERVKENCVSMLQSVMVRIKNILFVKMMNLIVLVSYINRSILLPTRGPINLFTWS